MSDLRIKDIPTTAAACSEDDYLAIDDATRGSAKVAAGNLRDTVVMIAGYATPVVGDVVHVLGHGAANVPLILKALANTTVVTSEPLYLVEGVAPGDVAGVGHKYICRRFGASISVPIGGSLHVGDPVYVTDLGGLDVTPGTNTRRVGQVLDTSTAIVQFDGEFGGGGGGGVPTSRQIIAGSGMSGGGDLTADRTLTLESLISFGQLQSWSGATQTGSKTARLLQYTGSGNTALTLDSNAPAANRERVHIVCNDTSGSGNVTVNGLWVIAPGQALVFKTTDGTTYTVCGGTMMRYFAVSHSDAQGDVFVRKSSAWGGLAAGTAGQFLETLGAGSDPAWAFIANLVFGSDARGDLAVRGSSAYGRLALGATGKRLRSDGTDASWSYQTAKNVSSTSYTLTAADEVIFVDKSGGNYTVNVPATNPGAGWRCRVKVTTTGSQSVTIARGAFGGSIEGAAADYVWALGASTSRPFIDIESDGTDYWVC